MTLPADSAANRAALVAQLYDDWHGHYMVQVVLLGRYVDMRPLDRAEALTYRCAASEALQVRWEQKGT